MSEANDRHAPIVLGRARQRLGLARDGVDLTARFANRPGDALLAIAAQLAAAGRSPEAAVEEQDDEAMPGQDRIEPALANADRGVEVGRR